MQSLCQTLMAKNSNSCFQLRQMIDVYQVCGCVGVWWEGFLARGDLFHRPFDGCFVLLTGGGGRLIEEVVHSLLDIKAGWNDWISSLVVPRTYHCCLILVYMMTIHVFAQSSSRVHIAPPSSQHCPERLHWVSRSISYPEHHCIIPTIFMIDSWNFINYTVSTLLVPGFLDV